MSLRCRFSAADRDLDLPDRQGERHDHEDDSQAERDLGGADRAHVDQGRAGHAQQQAGIPKNCIQRMRSSRVRRFRIWPYRTSSGRSLFLHHRELLGALSLAAEGVPGAPQSEPGREGLRVRLGRRHPLQLALGGRPAVHAGDDRGTTGRRSSSASWIISESARRSLARLRTPRSRSPAPCEICPLPPVEAKREAGGVGSRPMANALTGRSAFNSPPGRAPGGRPAVGTRPWRPGEPPGGSPRHTPTGTRKSNRLSFLAELASTLL